MRVVLRNEAGMITVLLVDDHAAVQKSLQYLIEKVDDKQVVAVLT